MVSVKALAVMVSSPFIRLHKSSIPQSRRVTELFIDDEERTLAKASIWRSNDPIVNNIAVLRVKGTHYEMGFQHGRLLETEVNSFYNSMLKLAIAYVGREGLYEAYHIMEPFIPSCYKEEMLGLAQGANLPLSSVHFAHVVPALTEYYHRTQFARGLFYRRPEQRDFVSQTCSFVTAWGDATVNGNMISLRNLDWLRFLNVQKTPTVTVYEYADGTSVANFGFAGFIGSITGMN
ncbi:hypothetical protein HN662_03305, partial [Candidatus Woesearchaeota archaeon]|nr:hypothetical protein [Candidatus Woesearchaeota archaeon]